LEQKDKEIETLRAQNEGFAADVDSFTNDYLAEKKEH